MSSFPAAPSGPAVVKTDKYIFFYGHELQIPESRLQMWYPSSFEDPAHPGIRFQTCEHYMTFRKALAMEDNQTAEKILKAHTPLEANRLGREVKNFDGQKWRELVQAVAEDCNWLKFSQVDECREVLLGTGDKILAEASPVDRNWGIGFRGDEAEGKESEWGRNILGLALMKVRERLRKESNM